MMLPNGIERNGAQKRVSRSFSGGEKCSFAVMHFKRMIIESWIFCISLYVY